MGACIVNGVWISLRSVGAVPKVISDPSYVGHDLRAATHGGRAHHAAICGAIGKLTVKTATNQTDQTNADAIGAMLNSRVQSGAQVLLDARLKLDAAATLIRIELERSPYGDKAHALANARMAAETALLWVDQARKK